LHSISLHPLILLGAIIGAVASNASAVADEPIIVGAKAFHQAAPEGTRLVKSDNLNITWNHATQAVNIGRDEPITLRVAVPEAGRYRLFVSSHGNENRGFSVAVNGKRDKQRFGHRELRWTQGDTYKLPAGEIQITLTDIKANPYFDALVLTRETWLPARFLPEPPTDPATLVVGASDMLQGLVRDIPIVGEDQLGVSVYRDFALNLRRRVPIVFDVKVPKTGQYHLFVRSHGNSKRGFEVEVNGQTANRIFGQGRMSWQWGGMQRLPAGKAEVRLKNVRPNPYIDALVLTQKRTLPKNVIRNREFPDDRKLIKEHAIPGGAVKFGDLTGDGRMDFIVLQSDYSVNAYSYEGEQLWQYDRPSGPDQMPDSIGFEPPGSLWDFNGDGQAAVIHWRWKDGDDKLVMADGETGEVLQSTAWPAKDWPHSFYNFRTAIAQLTSGRPNSLVVLSDSGGTISVTAYNQKLQKLWQHERHHMGKDHYGHYVYPVDVTGDGVDEVVAGHIVLKPNGEVLWDNTDAHDNYDHPDSMRFADITNDDQPELLAAHSNRGAVAIDALTGDYLWEHASKHAQQISVGNVLDGYAGPQVAITARSYGTRGGSLPYLWGELYYFTPTGKLVERWPGDPISGNPQSVVGDWTGTGKDTLFWYRFRMTREGRGELYFPHKVYHMFDCTGNGAAEVITIGNRDGGAVLRIWGSNEAKTGPAKRDPHYIQDHIANHSHY
jgi:hypothetical protein